MLYIKLDKTRKRSYTEQIYTRIREMILSGELPAGEALPSTRELSRALSIARNTVLTAYDMLVAEGAVYSISGSGYYVLSGVEKPRQSLAEGRQTASLSDMVIPDGMVNFDSGLPALDLFPRSKWNRTVSSAFMEAPVSALGYDDPQGRLEFREVLSRYLKRTRGISCSPDRILITSGTKQGLSLAAKCLLSPESEVWMEDPSNANVKEIFSYHTKNIVPFEVDAFGIMPDQFPESGKPRLIFVTPSHQFPLGGILPLQRRIALIAFARKTGAYILEDDYDSAFTYEGQPLHSLFELDPSHVIHAGTFSKIMFPSIRLGYLVVPKDLMPSMRELKRLSDHHSNSIYQLALMRFIENGDLDRHIRRMKKEYQKRRDLLLTLLPTYFGDQVQIYGALAGMHIVAAFDHVVFTEKHIQRLMDKGVYMVPVERHSLIKGNHVHQIILGYAGLSRDDLIYELDCLKEIISM